MVYIRESCVLVYKQKMNTKQNKIAILKDILEKKDILFGAFSDKLTKGTYMLERR